MERKVAGALLAWTKIAVAGCLVTVACGTACSSKSAGEGGIQTRISPNAQPLDDSTAKQATVKASSLVFKTKGNEDLANVQVGQVLVSGYQDGFLRRVTGVTNDGTNITIATEDATLTDVVEEGETSTTADLSTLMQSFPAGPGLKLQGVHQAAFDIDLSDKTIASDEKDGVSVRITKGSIHFVPQLDFDLRIKGGVSMHAIASGSLTVDLHVEASMRKAVSKSVRTQLWSLPQPVALPLPPIGGVPIPAKVQLSLDAGFDIQANGQITVDMGATTTTGAQYGIAYDDSSGWQPVGSINTTFTPDGPNIVANAEIHATAYVTGVMRVGLFGGWLSSLSKSSASVTATVEPYVQFDYSSSQSMTPWALRAGFRGNYYGSINVLGAQLVGIDPPGNQLFDDSAQIAPSTSDAALTPQPASCSDGVQDGNETDIDCGGSCSQRCGQGQGCAGDADCAAGACGPSGVCAPASCATSPYCGRDKSTCPLLCAGAACHQNSDCASGACDPNNAVCLPPGYCFDKSKDADETDIDCGGSCAPMLTCATGQKCSVNNDCTTGACANGSCVDVPQNCVDGVLDGDETGLDCGGSCVYVPQGGAPSFQCADGQACNAAQDCQSEACNNGICGTGIDCNTCSTQATSGSGACVAQVNACASDPDCMTLYNCLNNCTDQTCVTNCANAAPQDDAGVSPAIDEYNAMINCICVTACYTPCMQACGN